MFTCGLKALHTAYTSTDFSLEPLANKEWLPRGLSPRGTAFLDFRARVFGPDVRYDRPGRSVFRVGEEGQWIGTSYLRTLLPNGGWEEWLHVADQVIVPIKQAHRAELRYVMDSNISREDIVPALLRIQRKYDPSDYPWCNMCHYSSHPLHFETAPTLHYNLVCPRCGTTDIRWTAWEYHNNVLLFDKAYVNYYL